MPPGREDDDDVSPLTGAEVMAQFLPQSPFVTKLGVTAETLDGDEVRLRMPWDPTNVTLGDMVHGGAIAALADITVMAAAWAGVQAAESLRGVTTSMALQYLAPARATDLIGVGRVLRRGKTLVNCDVDVVTPDGELVAKAIATYKVG
ncbi:thioesterase [Mycobacterium antarcticum]|uniref:PaaI family thioesterase n=1 Tax=unclassified Mycolicibacterium TaxID=2636767 RepID=UPI00239675C7|nr:MULTISPECIES: PaaI family thioesterase [unclassified Mycolicibacterium]BDX30900.1 thioesterase [Mycolicibacterium sp. TUM20985]GLP74263.1 thioesterase [Mycolicibacterium sp. TUM20983]GLP80059.1 thioesterase [Mycolicibacterium sp. TUM20984]